MDVLYRRPLAGVSEILAELPDAPTYSAVRATLRTLEAKGHVAHQYDGPRYVYQATTPREEARRFALHRLVRTFFDESPSAVVAALLDQSASELSNQELERLSNLIDEAKQRR